MSLPPLCSPASARTSSTVAREGTKLCLLATPVALLTLADVTKEGLFEGICKEYAERGYAGFDISVQYILSIGKERFARALKEHGLVFVGKCYSSGGGCPNAAEFSHPPQGRDVDAHIAVFAAQVREVAGCALLRPFLLSISGQSGRDYFTQEDTDKFFVAFQGLEREYGVCIQHETHRHRLLFNPWTARTQVARHPTLHLLADLSHYLCVCEAPCDDPDLSEAVATLLPSVTHTHARVGHEEGPQVPDPSAPHWAKHVEGHVAWWKQIFREHIKRGAGVCTVTPEFLLFPYGPVGCLVEETKRHNLHIEGVVRQAWEEVVGEE
jgi:hypothetical protein